QEIGGKSHQLYLFFKTKEEIVENPRTIFDNLFYFRGLLTQPPSFLRTINIFRVYISSIIYYYLVEFQDIYLFQYVQNDSV
ncbi:hypothetical protein KBX49_11975, partial [Liquorilactobacillus satsumensis]